MQNNNWREASVVLKNNGVIVLPTDTLYGVVGSALSKKAVERIYDIKGRKENKPFIVLINSILQLKNFGIKINDNQAKILGKVWPGKVSVILPCNTKRWRYLHRGTKSIAFRMINKRNKNLFKLIKEIGPVVAPSANTEGSKPAETTREAKKYFTNKIDYYVSDGKKGGEPSTLIRIIGDKVDILRQGKTKLKF